MMEMDTSATLTNVRMQQFVKIQNEAQELFSKKNADYGDAFAIYGSVGILVRIGDKLQRMQTITKKGINLVNDEKLRDTLIDLHNYAAMAIMLLDEKDINNLEQDVGNLELDVENTVSETNPASEIWKIKGSSGCYYERQCFIDGDMRETHSCSCPSFIYCTSQPRSCKHTKNAYPKI